MEGRKSGDDSTHEMPVTAALTTNTVNNAMANCFVFCMKTSGVGCEDVRAKEILGVGRKQNFKTLKTVDVYSYCCVLNNQSYYLSSYSEPANNLYIKGSEYLRVNIWIYLKRIML